ncbi:hypothetical protein GC207_00645 [bacterium]|nr:hypothetical protein [bacterium]
MTRQTRLKLRQAVLIGTFIPFCWLAMQIVHESGHVMAARFTGGPVAKVVLHPFALSRTDVSPNPHPGFVVWAGVTFGSLFPLLLWIFTRPFFVLMPHLFRFFAGFCSVANGVYLIGGTLMSGADPGDMIKNGASPILIIFLGILGMAGGMFLWHRQGKYFGIGPTPTEVKLQAVVASILLLVAVAVGELIWGSR